MSVSVQHEHLHIILYIFIGLFIANAVGQCEHTIMYCTVFYSSNPGARSNRTRCKRDPMYSPLPRDSLCDAPPTGHTWTAPKPPEGGTVYSHSQHLQEINILQKHSFIHHVHAYVYTRQQAQGPKTPRPITVHFKKSLSSSALEVGMWYLL